jgi:hypothetical protein
MSRLEIHNTMAGLGNIPTTTASSSSSSLSMDVSLSGNNEYRSHEVTVDMGCSNDDGSNQSHRSKLDAISDDDMKLVQRWKYIFLGVVRDINPLYFHSKVK